MIERSRFPDVAPDAGHYESWFVKGVAPEGGRAFWLRHTIHQRPGEPQTASLWLTLFDGDEVTAGKQTVAGASVPGGGHVEVAGATLRPGRGQGALRSPTLDADWDFGFTGAGAPQLHLPAGWMYDAPVPRTKSGTPYPGVTFSGSVGPLDVDGWRGLISHNWGSEHAERWIWSHTALPDGRGWLELVIGRIRLGSWTVPWIANGALELDGTRTRLGGLDAVRSTRIEEEPTGFRFVVRGEGGVRVEGAVRAPASRFVCWRYADPDGPEHHSAHSSVCDAQLEVRRTSSAPVVFDLPMAASYELGMRETDHGLPVQPYPDGTL